eukprot:CAMPEP_0170503250 /NCGR_PEP_ID=MMETSP0208-20121228/44103_1 /TAXON_ID=197538 /ORGANISM="Strombidium inclinatum, Strain S3" /LENGTH=106 /DNA_ID=CAMNT_0010782795 /DNA_START=271 /DNA_END=591 /DNA_ORIENTATION=+
MNFSLLATGDSNFSYSANSTVLNYKTTVNGTTQDFVPAFNLSITTPDSEEENSSTSSSGAPSYDYELHGEDWPYKFPECGVGVQSPINLLPPYTKYGQSYEIFDFK